MTTIRRPKPWWRRSRAVLASVALLALVLGPAAVNGTLADWTDTKTSQGLFAAGSVNVGKLTCTDKADAPLLGLLANEVDLNWTAPPGADSKTVKYIVTWKTVGIGPSGSKDVDATTLRYRATGSLLAVSVNFTVQAVSKTGNWKGQTLNVSALNLGVAGVNVVLSC